MATCNFLNKNFNHFYASLTGAQGFRMCVCASVCLQRLLRARERERELEKGLKRGLVRMFERELEGPVRKFK